MTLRVRALDASGDMTFGYGQLNMLVDSPEAVGQIVGTRVMLKKGEWFLDNTAGTDFEGAIIGIHPDAVREAEIRSRIVGSPNVTGLTAFSAVTLPGRKWDVSATIQTDFSVTPVTVQQILS